MTAVSGSIEAVTLKGREFAVAADAESQRKLGGTENEVRSNGNGTARLVKTRVPFLLDGLTVVVDDARGDHEFLQALADRKDFWPLSVTYASGETFGGTGQIVGEMQYSSQAGTAALSLSGPDKLVPQ